jgi:hypothetical protein
MRQGFARWLLGGDQVISTPRAVWSEKRLALSLRYEQRANERRLLSSASHPLHSLGTSPGHSKLASREQMQANDASHIRSKLTHWPSANATMTLEGGEQLPLVIDTSQPTQINSVANVIFVVNCSLQSDGRYVC